MCVRRAVAWNHPLAQGASQLETPDRTRRRLAIAIAHRERTVDGQADRGVTRFGRSVHSSPHARKARAERGNHPPDGHSTYRKHEKPLFLPGKSPARPDLYMLGLACHK